MTNKPSEQDKTPAPDYYEDEISLIDLWLVLAKRKVVIFAVVVICFIMGLVYALTMPRLYQYSTSIEIGTRISGVEVSMFEPPPTLLAKIQETYIPLIRQGYLAAHSEQQGVPALEARIPKGSQIIVLNSNGQKSDLALHVSLHEAVVERVKKDHSRILNVIRKEIVSQQQLAVTELEALMDGVTLIAAREQRHAGLAALLGKQAREARADLEQAVAERQRATKEVTDATRAMTLLLLDSEIQQHRQRVSEIDERLQVEVGQDQDALVKELADNKRAQINQQNKIENLIAQLTNLQETHALTVPMRSLEPVGAGREVIVMLSLVLGVMLGLFSAFFAEFISKARDQARQASGL